MAKWYKESVNPNNLSLWKQLIKDLNFTFKKSAVILLFQFVMDKFLKHGLKFRNSLLESKDETQVPMDNQILESDEEESLRYVAGYILYSLKNSIKSSDPYLKKAVSGINGIWGGKKDIGCNSSIPFLEYTQYWLEQVNLGWLIYVTYDFYKFIRKIEYTIRQVLNMKLIVAYAGENLRNVLLEKLKEKKNLNEDETYLKAD